MIRPLRKRHQILTISMALVVAVVLFLGLSARRPIPPADAIALQQADSFPGNLTDVSEPELPWKTVKLKTKISYGMDGRYAISLTPVDYIAQPDILVYWTPADDFAPNGISPSAYLIGSLSGQTAEQSFWLPDSAHTRDGALTLYSLPNQAVVDRALIPQSHFKTEGQ